MEMTSKSTTLKHLTAFLLFLILLGMSEGQAQSVFEHVPSDTALASQADFFVIDDFDASVVETKLKTKWVLSTSQNASIEARQVKGGSLTSWGKAVEISTSLSQGSSAHFQAPLGQLDMSQAESLVFLVGEAGYQRLSDHIQVKLKDALGNTHTQNITAYTNDFSLGPKNGDKWMEAQLPRSLFEGLDFNQLDSLEFIFSSDKFIQGKLVIDLIAFFGKQVELASMQDNLRDFPKEVAVEGRQETLLATKNDNAFLRLVAEDTWLYFENLIDQKTNLIVDHVRLGRHAGVGEYTSPTNIALYWLACVAAAQMDIISTDEAKKRIRLSLDSTKQLDRWKSGFWYNFYHTQNLKVTRKYVSTVDNGWLAIALVVLRQAFPEEFATEATTLLNELDFSVFFDASNGQLKIGYDDDTETFSPYHYGLLATEARIASYVGIGKGDLEVSHWAQIFRTLPREWDWQSQIPEGGEETLFETQVFEGYYTYQDQKFVPSWGGSLFEFLAPILVVDEQSQAPLSLGKNNTRATDLTIHYAKEKGYPVWGFAPSAVQNGRGWSYREFGIPELGSKGYPEKGVATPYASFLALGTRPKQTIQNLRAFLKHYASIYGPYGFYDSVLINKGTVNPQYLVLDQAMSFLAMANFLEGNVIQGLFGRDRVGMKIKNILGEERFHI